VVAQTETGAPEPQPDNEEWHVTVAIAKIDMLMAACRTFKEHTPAYLIEVVYDDEGNPDPAQSHHPMDDIIGMFLSLRQGLFAHYGRAMYRAAQDMNTRPVAKTKES
jgi:hypothetical protein